MPTEATLCTDQSEIWQGGADCGCGFTAFGPSKLGILTVNLIDCILLVQNRRLKEFVGVLYCKLF